MTQNNQHEGVLRSRIIQVGRDFRSPSNSSASSKSASKVDQVAEDRVQKFWKSPTVVMLQPLWRLVPVLDCSTCRLIQQPNKGLYGWYLSWAILSRQNMESRAGCGQYLLGAQHLPKKTLRPTKGAGELVFQAFAQVQNTSTMLGPREA